MDFNHLKNPQAALWDLQHPRERLFRRIKGRYKINNWPLDITIKDIPEIPELCIYIPILGKLIIGEGNGHKTNKNSLSADRFNSSLPTYKNNIQITSNLANRMKSDSSLEEQVQFSTNTILLHTSKDWQIEFAKNILQAYGVNNVSSN